MFNVKICVLAPVAQRIRAFVFGTKGRGFESLQGRHYMSVLLNKKVLTDVTNQLREQDKSVVLTHGAFDLFHIGHAQLLKEAKKLGDYLVVGLESDERVATYKESRPIIPLSERAEILLDNRYLMKLMMLS